MVKRVKISLEGLSDEEMDYHKMDCFNELLYKSGLDRTDLYFHNTIKENVKNILKNGIEKSPDNWVNTTTFIDGIDTFIDVPEHRAIIVISSDVSLKNASYWYPYVDAYKNEGKYLDINTYKDDMVDFIRMFKMEVWKYVLKREQNLLDQYKEELESGKYTRKDLHLGPSEYAIDIFFNQIDRKYIMGYITLENNKLTYRVV